MARSGRGRKPAHPDECPPRLAASRAPGARSTRDNRIATDRGCSGQVVRPRPAGRATAAAGQDTRRPAGSLERPRKIETEVEGRRRDRVGGPRRPATAVGGAPCGMRAMSITCSASSRLSIGGKTPRPSAPRCSPGGPGASSPVCRPPGPCPHPTAPRPQWRLDPRPRGTARPARLPNARSHRRRLAERHQKLHRDQPRAPVSVLNRIVACRACVAVHPILAGGRAGRRGAAAEGTSRAPRGCRQTRRDKRRVASIHPVVVHHVDPEQRKSWDELRLAEGYRLCVIPSGIRERS